MTKRPPDRLERLQIFAGITRDPVSHLYHVEVSSRTDFNTMDQLYRRQGSPAAFWGRYLHEATSHLIDGFELEATQRWGAADEPVDSRLFSTLLREEQSTE